MAKPSDLAEEVTYLRRRVAELEETLERCPVVEIKNEAAPMRYRLGGLEHVDPTPPKCTVTIWWGGNTYKFTGTEMTATVSPLPVGLPTLGG